MRFAKSWRPVSFLAATLACILVLGACSAGSLGSSDDEGGGTTLTFLVDNAEGSLKPAQGSPTPSTPRIPTSPSRCRRALAAARATTSSRRGSPRAR
jgi:hypothetical protein